jgi:hypothetical protein
MCVFSSQFRVSASTEELFWAMKTFCSTCLLRSLDHSPLCPLCRQDLPGFAFYHEHPSSRVLLDISCVRGVLSLRSMLTSGYDLAYLCSQNGVTIAVRSTQDISG